MHPASFQEVVAQLAARRLLPVPATVGSATLSRLPAALADQAVFSAKVGNARVLQAILDRLRAIAEPEAAAPGASMDTARAREEIRAALAATGYAPEPGKEGSIEDLYSEQRLNLIIDHNTAAARGRGQFEQTQDPTILDEWPCQELIRAEERYVKRNWKRRWVMSGGRLVGGGRMVARKDDPIWTAISRFGTPWPPFDFNSGMRLQDIDRAEAERLGVIQPGETVAPQTVAGVLAQPAASLASLDPALAGAVRAAFPGYAG